MRCVREDCYAPTWFRRKLDNWAGTSHNACIAAALSNPFVRGAKAWDSWLDLFTADAVLEWDLAVGTRGADPPTQRCVGVEEIQRRVVREYLDPSTSVHQGHTPLLELRSETEDRKSVV